MFIEIELPNVKFGCVLFRLNNITHLILQRNNKPFNILKVSLIIKYGLQFFVGISILRWSGRLKEIAYLQ